MPWNSNFGSDMQGACKEIPGSAQDDQGYSTPDVYGRAVQMYLALERAAQDQEFEDGTVLLWRGLLTMLALRNMLDLPLVWSYVQISPGDPLSNALSFPPKDVNQLLYPNDPQYQWNGTAFYVLSWAPHGHDPVELAIYSPMTLVYPVADWRKVFAGIPQLDKFYNSSTHMFRSHEDAIQGGELNFVYLWLRDMKDHLDNHPSSSNARRNIILQIEQYMKELGARDNSLSSKKLPLNPEQFEYTTQLANLVPPLVTSYGIGGPVFSDQLCVLQVEKGAGNPFDPCAYKENYIIRSENGRDPGRLNPDVDLFAFLPIHPGRREKCRENGLAGSITMRLRIQHEGGIARTYIHASASTADLPGIRLEKDYLLLDGDSAGKSVAEKNVAVFYKDAYNHDVVLNPDIWPLVSVWPTTLDADWKQYYVMRSSQGDCLRISGEPGTGNALEGGAYVEKGDNPYIVKTPYVPDVIPLVRMLPDEDGKFSDQCVAVGVVTPERGLSVKGTGGAVVAVDFGTSSTRVFYSLVGNNQPIHEIMVVQDKPLEVTAYEKSVDRKLEMSTFFISPSNDNNQTLFSIFRRCEDKNRGEVRPLLDGAIYQPEGEVAPGATQKLVTDLKWNGPIARPYYIAFMQQLCLHIMTYLYKKYQVGSIEWHYALPRVMDETIQMAMNSIWQNEVLSFLNMVSANTISHAVTVPPTPDQPRPRLPLLTESIAASRYFDRYRGREINPTKGYLVVDIGGGSTDAALWQKEGNKPIGLKWHSSVRVAGRRMFTKWVEQCIEDMAVGLNDPESDSLLRTIKEGDFARHQDLGAREALVDRLLTAHSKFLHANYNTNITTHPGGWAALLRNRITQAVTLLMFSLGYQVGALMKKPQPEKEDPEKGDPEKEDPEKVQPEKARYRVPLGPGYFTIAFGGRGAKMLDWLTCGIPTLTSFFKEGVVAASGEKWPNVAITVITSDDPKCEVAMGLLVPSTAGSPTGWEDVGKGELMENPNYFADTYADDPDDYGNPVILQDGAATAYYKAFQDAFPTGYDDIKDLSSDSNQSELATAASRMIQMGSFVDDVFKVLMESIYDVMET